MNGSQFNAGSGLASVAFSALILLAFAASAFGSAANSAARATTPQTSYQSGLINTPNPIDQSGNLAITGNVAGGQHFRGNIPYRSTSSFGAPLGSTSLDSFLRYSATPQEQAGYPQNYSPFYSPTRTMTTTSPGYQGVFAAPSPKIAGGLTQLPMDRLTDTMSVTEIPQFHTPTGDLGVQGSSIAGQSLRLPYWPVPAGFGEAKDSISDETSGLSTVRRGDSLADPLMTPEEYQYRLQLLLQDLDRVRASASQIEQKLNADGTRTLQQLPSEFPGQWPLPEVGRDGMRELANEPGDRLAGIGSESTGLRLYDPSVRPEDGLFPAAAQMGEIRATVMDPRPDTAAGSPALADTLQRISEYASRLQAGSGTDRAVRNAAQPDQNPVETASPQQSSAEVVRQTYENAASITQQQFDQYLAAAEMNMRQGRYDRAADFFTLALAYVSHDSRPHFGKSHALLAVGDYVNSALSLVRAVELAAGPGLRKVDLVETVGGPDLFVTRITNLEELAQRDDAPALQFLLAYVYWQMDRLNEARIAVEAARGGTMSPVAVGRLAAALGR